MDNFRLVEIAKTDLDAAQTLFKEGFYSQAIFSTQQSIEKLSKYLALDSDSISFEELHKKIGHNSLEAFKISVVKHLEDHDQIDGESSLLLSKPPQSEKELNDVLTQFSGINSYDLKNLDHEHLRSIIKMISDVNEAPNPTNLDLERISNLDINELIKVLETNRIIQESDSKSIIDAATQYPEFRKHLNKLVASFLGNLPGYIAAIATIFYCSVVFTRHAISSRYPDSKTNFDPNDFYNVKSPLVTELPIFHQYLERSIEMIVKYYAESPKNNSYFK